MFISPHFHLSVCETISYVSSAVIVFYFIALRDILKLSCLRSLPYRRQRLRITVLFLRSSLFVRICLTTSLIYCSTPRYTPLHSAFSPPCNVPSLAISHIEFSVSFALLQNGCVIVINMSLLCCTKNYSYLLLLITYIVYLLPFENCDFPLVTPVVNLNITMVKNCEHVPHFSLEVGCFRFALLADDCRLLLTPFRSAVLP